MSTIRSTNWGATLSATYYRNATSKKTESVVPRGNGDFTADFSSNNETATLKAVVAAQGSYAQTTCQYTVTNSHTDENSGGQKNSTAFSNAGCSTSDDGTAYNFTCDRSWGGGKSRWKGSFALAD